MKDSFSINMRERWSLGQALDYVKDRPRPKHAGLTWLINQLPKGVVIEFPRVTETYPDLNAQNESSR